MAGKTGIPAVAQPGAQPGANTLVCICKLQPHIPSGSAGKVAGRLGTGVVHSFARCRAPVDSCTGCPACSSLSSAAGRETSGSGT